MLLMCKHMLYALFKQNEVHPVQGEELEAQLCQ